jgi:hypothetical protein
MWAAGAVCFFAAWGRSGPQEAAMNNVAAAFSLNLIGGLIAAMVIGDILIVNPIIRMASGKRVFGEEKTGIMFVFSLPLNIIKVTAIMLLIVRTYYFLNVFFIRLLGIDENYVPVPLEPILFGILYGLYYLFFETGIKFISGKVITRKEPTAPPEYNKENL